MKVFIRSAAAISAQDTFRNEGFLDQPVEYTGTRLPVIEPDYKEYIDPKLIRRMSHVIKRGVAAAKQCLNEANIEMPGAVITGTAFGCMEDTITFLTRIVEGDEEMLPPTAFIQSTHNTVAAQIALMLKCHEYNNTFVHKGISFESALTDAVMLLNEGDTDTVLAGGTEEMVETSFKVLTRLGLYKRHPVSNLNLFDEDSKGTIGSEGAAFFLLTAEPSDENMAELVAVRTLYKPDDLQKAINSFVSANGLRLDDIDLLITGKNGDIRNDSVYKDLQNDLFKNIPAGNYKHLCGEYPVSASFALWLAANILKKGMVPPVVSEKKANDQPPKKILIYNHYQNKYHSLMLVSAV
ncbi:beta-ketoacyl synthase N-terminal-like domain-containing protein [Mucilaginibacter ginsenosidivorans]|uniref:Beta-ketoacyl synthase n=1 Tax=Mucilaginibacter ginsenosidivorans TaxID=398053 RepID=A0A5B8UTC0_9SPHI|nr:beta-ketoacyl synthase N-terminal-like domain-containing protein [Mucilaginibacter ginsenosidivorans]QEC62219.1 beta-ketoacyl synthase [Mucilaginibacter ginsenosidivorans]